MSSARLLTSIRSFRLQSVECRFGNEFAEGSLAEGSFASGSIAEGSFAEGSSFKSVRLQYVALDINSLC